VKISLVGPTHPFRGGIAQHTTLLFRHLRTRHQVRFYAFKRQYPAWLFPGKSDRDPSQAPLIEEGAERLLDSLNPLSWIRVSRRIIADQPDLVVIPWWTFFWTPQFLTVCWLVSFFSKARFLFVCHNVYDHEASAISRLCARLVLRRGDCLIVHSREDYDRLSTFVPENRIKLGFLTANEMADSLPSDEAKRSLGVEGEVLLFFGFIRPYKGLEHLLEALPLILRERRVTLLVVGESWNGSEAITEQMKRLGLERHVVRFDQYVPNEDVPLYFSAADLVVLPYVSCTGSGIVQTAFAFNRPVVATRVGSLVEAVEDGRTGYLVDPADSVGLAQAVIRFFVEQRGPEFSRNIEQDKKQFGWDRFLELFDETTLPFSSAGSAPSSAGSEELRTDAKAAEG
jgi:glycosyltransferase involved in cell wall biosynthesis